MESLPLTPPPSRPTSTIITCSIDSQKDTEEKEVTNSDMAGPITPIEQHDRWGLPDQRQLFDSSPAKREMHLFLPGEKTLARSNEDDDPVDIDEMRKLRAETQKDLWKSIGPMQRSLLTKKTPEEIFPMVEKVADYYWEKFRAMINSIALVTISGWYGSNEGSKVWLLLTGENDKLDHMIDMVKELEGNLRELGYDDLHCVILEDTYCTRADAVSQPPKPHQPFDHTIANATSDDARHFSLISGGSISASLEGSDGHLTQEQGGTIAAYYTNGRAAIGISCSHVVGNQGAEQHLEYHDSAVQDLKIKVHKPGASTYKAIMENLNVSIDRYQEALDSMGFPYTQEYLMSPQKSKQSSETVRQYQNLINETQAFQERITTMYDTNQKRYIGYTLWASGMNNIPGERFCQDVGLVMLDLKPDVVPENVMPILKRVVTDDQPRKHDDHDTCPELEVAAEKPWVEFRPDQYVRREFLTQPPAQYRDRDMDPKIFVTMTGKTSGTRKGILSPETTRRVIIRGSDDNRVWVHEYTVYGVNGIEFSQHGDSGAMCVVPDTNGRPLMLGLVSAGDSITASTDRTSIYPWFDFVERVLPYLIRQKILPDGPHDWSMKMQCLKSSEVVDGEDR